ncbi:hypothetical protein FNV43_RR26926 [Rhamnella rubrinervis]|uniref:Uncharacterized protein n=1 Tax=Rhamnella rubrinervis TaxID=2594499 RepID=A0A8K0DVV8_9ROSA|nr:hypothetical protein FNV43_RR26926 [Rhamnella rubrinervis]
MRLYNGVKEILKIQKFRRIVSYAGFYCFVSVLSYAYTSNTTRAGYSRADQFYASYPAGTELLTDTEKLYKAALGNCFEAEEWGPVEFCIMAKHFERQGKSPYAYHAMKNIICHMLLYGESLLTATLVKSAFELCLPFTLCSNLLLVVVKKCHWCCAVEWFSELSMWRTGDVC